MTIQELAEKCCDVINQGGSVVQLVLPQRRQEYEHYYLAGEKSPKGRRIGFIAGGELVDFEASDVLAFCIVLGAQVTVNMSVSIVGSDADDAETEERGGTLVLRLQEIAAERDALAERAQVLEAHNQRLARRLQEEEVGQ